MAVSMVLCIGQMPCAAEPVIIPAEITLAKGSNLKPCPVKGFFTINETGLGSAYTFRVSNIRCIVRERVPGSQTDSATVISLCDWNGTMSVVIVTIRIPASVTPYDAVISALASA